MKGRRNTKESAREVALHVVRDVFSPEARGAQAAFDVRARRADLDARDRAFAAELAYGSIKTRRLIDWQLVPYVGGRTKPLPATISEVLRLGAYQLRFMSGVDDHAAVSESVKLAWAHGHRGTAGLVNAVLRRMQSDGPRAPERVDFAADADYLGTAHSVPTWVAAQFLRSLDGLAEAALAGVNAAPQAAVRVNALRADEETVRRYFDECGVAVHRSTYVDETLLLDDGKVSDDPEGRWSVQGEAAAMPVDVLAPQPGETVLELCSGRGNKTAQIASRMRDRGTLVCVERDAKKMTILEAMLARQGVTLTAPVLGDARDASAEVRADAVLLDAPCSGIGVIGRHPEARWRKTAEDGARLAPLQSELLRAAALRTKPGGRLVYSVCSIDPREGRAVVDAFLAEDPQFVRAPVAARYECFARDGDMLVPPGIEGRDGFYIAALARRS